MRPTSLLLLAAAPLLASAQLDSIINGVTSVISDIESAGQKLTSDAGSVYTVVTNAGGNIVSTITSDAEALGTRITSAGGSLVTEVTNAAGGVVSTITSDAGALGTKITSAGGSLITEATNATGSVVSTVTNGAAGVTDSSNAAPAPTAAAFMAGGLLGVGMAVVAAL